MTPQQISDARQRGYVSEMVYVATSNTVGGSGKMMYTVSVSVAHITSVVADMEQPVRITWPALNNPPTAADKKAAYAEAQRILNDRLQQMLPADYGYDLMSNACANLAWYRARCLP